MPTLIWNKDVTADNLSKEDFLENYARLVNTSVAVLEEHYIRGRATEKSKQVIQTIEKEILSTPESNIYIL